MAGRTCSRGRHLLRQRSQCAGFSLIEVLVSVIVLSIGLIGIARLQAASLANDQSSFMRSQATAMAYDLADRMRANVNSANSLMYNTAVAGITANCVNPSGCSPQQMAQHDVAEWSAALSTYMPMGQGFVCRDSTPNDGTSAANALCDGAGTQFAVKIWWDDDRDGVISVTPTNLERLVISFEL